MATIPYIQSSIVLFILNILGVSAFYHDSAAALVADGEIIAAAQEERFTRKKHDSGFPKHAIEYCFKEASFPLNKLDAIVFYDKPFIKMERLLESYYAFAPKGLPSFLRSIPILLREKLFIKQILRREFRSIDPRLSQVTILFSEHHLSHAASTFYPSPFKEAAILTVDGVGEWSTACIFKGEGSSIKLIQEQKYPHSVGLFYSSFTYFLGFMVNSGEYKLMGLAPFGKKNSFSVERFKKLILKHVISIKKDGSIWLNQSSFKYTTGLKMIVNRKWAELFGFKRRLPGEEIKQTHCDLALAVQEITNEIILKMTIQAKQLTGFDSLCMAGGVALNCVANAEVVKAGLFRDVFIQPAAGDAGGALGAALAVNHLYFKEDRAPESIRDRMKGALLGPSFSDKEILELTYKYDISPKLFPEDDALISQVAQLIETGKVVGWFDGRMEFGPRALGSRSILANAKLDFMQKHVNEHIKFREDFRPFGASVLEEDAPLIFNLKGESPYMLLTYTLKDEFLGDPTKDPEHSEGLKQSRFPAVTHIDHTSRIQTVDVKTNPRFFLLLKEIKKISGWGMVLNTSFNIKDQPIVCTPEEAFLCFKNTALDYLVIKNYLFTKDTSNT